MQMASTFLPSRPSFLMASVVASFLAMIGSAVAQNNEPPPAGAILDLGGQAIPQNTAQQYSVDFVASVANTAITFAFRDDPGFITFSDPSLINLTTSSGNLLQNSTFTAGTYTSSGNNQTPIDWIYANQYGASNSGAEQSGGGALSGSNSWSDGAVQAYDAISQTVPTAVGDSYRLSFYVSEDSGLSTFSDLSTNGRSGTGGNGIDVLAYAQNGLPPPSVPEPGSLALLASGITTFGLMRRRHKKTG